MRLLVTGPYFTVVISLDFSSTCGIMYFADALKKPFGASVTRGLGGNAVQRILDFVRATPADQAWVS